MKKICAICETDLSINSYHLICYSCYKEWEEDIKSGKEWVRYLVNEERKRRRDKKQNKLVFFGDLYDLDDGGNLVFRG